MTTFECPQCGFKIHPEGDSGDGPTWYCEGDNWPGVDRGRHPQTEMTETRLSRWLSN